ncbi:MAG: hypothetical protein HYY96_01490 [Candidatus Tectomicrobia bacterium]|nr:hypothetical protein [Candidatus Tectomicrobia bacterium]
MDPALRAQYEEYLARSYGLTYATTQVRPEELRRFADWLAETPYGGAFEEIRAGITRELGLVISLGYQWHWNIETAAHLYLDEDDFQETGLDYWSRVRGTVQGAVRSLLARHPFDGGEAAERQLLLELIPLLKTRLQLPESGLGMALCLALLVLKLGPRRFAEEAPPEES